MATQLLEAEGFDAHLLAEDFFGLATPDQLGSPLPVMTERRILHGGGGPYACSRIGLASDLPARAR
jgi:hypothetical protein